MNKFLANYGHLVVAAAVLLLVAAITQAQERNAVITFAAPTQYTDGSMIDPGTVISYLVYQGAKGAEKVQVATISETSATISTGLAGGVEYCWQISAVVNGVESALSNEGCKAFAFPTPETVTITVQ